jgi:hypothetical protein
MGWEFPPHGQSSPLNQRHIDSAVLASATNGRIGPASPSQIQCLNNSAASATARQGRSSAPPRLRSIAPRIAAGADTLTADRLPARCRPAGLPPGVTAVPASEALQLDGCSPACFVVRAEWSCLSLRCSRRMVASVEVRPRRSIAPVLKKVSVELLPIALPLDLRRRGHWLPGERLSDRPWFDRSNPMNYAHDDARNGRSTEKGNRCSDI